MKTHKASDKLSILKNGPDSFKGRKLGILVSDGMDRGIYDALVDAVEAEGGMVEVIAPKVGGVKTSEGDMLPANQKIDGGPSVLYDAVAIVVSDEGARELAAMLPGKQFVADAYGHCKFIALTPEAAPLFEAAGVNSEAEGVMTLKKPAAAADFLEACHAVRVWDRKR
ncbi:hypothetical protein JF540_24275 [Salipiger thiooxidans]|uniref:hypothetical protein n=1 Tax=Salipiger thiooxidans TaxID=282683 RepID=UPI001A8E7732|nr:hypothetical protein [Salipiger thiooxidans]MBN8189808.1 hypothetical protein [Salipiger thiooxidans]